MFQPPFSRPILTIVNDPEVYCNLSTFHLIHSCVLNNTAPCLYDASICTIYWLLVTRPLPISNMVSPVDPQLRIDTWLLAYWSNIQLYRARLCNRAPSKNLCECLQIENPILLLSRLTPLSMVRPGLLVSYCSNRLK